MNRDELLENIRSLCQRRIRQVVSYQDADLVDEIFGEKIERLPTVGTYTVIVKGLSVECEDLHINDDAVYCVRADDEAIQIDINILDESSLKVIADKISNDIAKTEEWADNFFG